MLSNFTNAVSLSAAHSVLSLNRPNLITILQTAPQELAEGEVSENTRLTLPTPAGGFLSFRIQRSPVSEGTLGSAGMQSVTYKGIGIDDPTASARLEVAPDGFHAIVRCSAGTFYIDPVNQKSKGPPSTPYLSYFSDQSRPRGKPHQSAGKDFNCVVTSPQSATAKKVTAKPQSRPGEILRDKYRRTYRVAVAADSAYADAVFDKEGYGDKKDQALRAVQRTINRIDEIYESELGIRLVLVKNEDQLIFTDPSSDPFAKVNTDANAAIDITQATVDRVIGEKNYDIGHLFATGTAGLATLRSACVSGIKAKATTGMSAPTGDGFDVDYVAHEMGHQFGANHTFNGTIDACGGGRRNSDTAFEPGSGSTIMSYTGPGLCGTESIQPDSDPYFHAASLAEIAAFVQDASPTGGDCGAKTNIPSLDIPPVDAGQDFAVPKNTPFLLTPTTSTARPLEFAWEEYDLGAPGPPDDEGTPASSARPLFRSRRPDLVGTRYIPVLESLVDPVPTTAFAAEALPQLDRTIVFRLTARNGFGRSNFSDVHVHVDASSGPFRLEQPTGGTAWARGSAHKIVWDVAHTDQPPLHIQTVQISLLLDSDPSKEVILSANAPNSGSAIASVPTQTAVSSHAILKISAVGSHFFSVAPQTLQIVPQ